MPPYQTNAPKPAGPKAQATAAGLGGISRPQGMAGNSHAPRDWKGDPYQEQDKGR